MGEKNTGSFFLEVVLRITFVYSLDFCLLRSLLLPTLLRSFLGLEKKHTTWGRGVRSGDKKNSILKHYLRGGLKMVKNARKISVHPQRGANTRAVIPTAQMENRTV